MLRNQWGIRIHPNTSDSTGNVIRNNRLHGNGRAGVSIEGVARGNTVEGNDATGNGLLNIAPTLAFDLFNQLLPVDNIWRNNSGNANFPVSTSTAMSNTQAMQDALASDPCALGVPVRSPR